MVDVAPALDRIGPNVAALTKAVADLEAMLAEAESSDKPEVHRALPFVGLFWLYASAMRDLLHAKRADGKVLWNAPALAALCRPLQDAYLSLFYFAIEKVDPHEAEFRDLLVHRHHKYKTVHLLREADQSVHEIAAKRVAAEKDFENAQQLLSNHPWFEKLPEKTKKLIAGQHDNYLFEDRHVVWRNAGMPEALYSATFVYLSQWVHATPYALHQLADHHAESEPAAVRMNTPIGLAIMCTYSVMTQLATLDAALDLPEPHERLFKTE